MILFASHAENPGVFCRPYYMFALCFMLTKCQVYIAAEGWYQKTHEPACAWSISRVTRINPRSESRGAPADEVSRMIYPGHTAA